MPSHTKSSGQVVSLPNSLDPHRVLNPKASSAFLGVSESTYRRLIKAGELKCVRISERRIGSRASDLVAYLEEHAA